MTPFSIVVRIRTPSVLPGRLVGALSPEERPATACYRFPISSLGFLLLRCPLATEKAGPLPTAFLRSEAAR